MFNPEDILQIQSRGCQPETILQQIESFRNGFPFAKLVEAASNYHGIIKLSESEISYYVSLFEEKKSNGLDLLKFVPASGAASRMFKSLFSALDDLKKGKSPDEIKYNKEVALFFDQLAHFAFYDDLLKLAASANRSLSEIPEKQLLEWVLTKPGLNYGNSPKAVIKFHRYHDWCRTSLEEHFVEGAMYSTNNKNIVKLHFTVSEEHQPTIEKLVAEIRYEYENMYGVTFEINFSNQKPSTDTIAVTPENELFRDSNNQLLFRPAGHGALLDNLNELDADLIFIKNIDNVAPDHLKPITVKYKKALAGILISLQEQIYHYQEILNTHQPEELESSFYAEVTDFMENVLLVTPPCALLGINKTQLHQYLSKKINRPVRVCGMVRNLGEPGGGPFFALNNDQSISLQIVESSQIDFGDIEQVTIAKQATHFNPVDLVCGTRNFEGKKYDLKQFIDPQTGLISLKSYDGKELKAQELPGLWNGSMSDWNTLFVEVPVETFSPVKTVTDLLRKEHRA